MNTRKPATHDREIAGDYMMTERRLPAVPDAPSGLCPRHPSDPRIHLRLGVPTGSASDSVAVSPSRCANLDPCRPALRASWSAGSNFILGPLGSVLEEDIDPELKRADPLRSVTTPSSHCAHSRTSRRPICATLSTPEFTFRLRSPPDHDASNISSGERQPMKPARPFLIATQVRRGSHGLVHALGQREIGGRSTLQPPLIKRCLDEWAAAARYAKKVRLIHESQLHWLQGASHALRLRQPSSDRIRPISTV